MSDLGPREIAPGLLRLADVDGTRLLSQFVLFDDAAITIVDAGLPSTPATAIVPAIESLGAAGRELRLIITHPDADHFGGSAVLKQVYPHLRIIAHVHDVPPMGSPTDTLAMRYQAFAESDALCPDAIGRARIIGRMGPPFHVDDALDGDTWFPFRKERAAILHVPGHSRGHLAVWIPEHHALIAGDALMGRGIPNLDGTLLYPPQVVHAKDYKRTIQRVRQLGVKTLLCSHEEPMLGNAVADFLATSDEAVDGLNISLMTALSQGKDTLVELCESVRESYAGGISLKASDFAFTVNALLDELITAGTVAVHMDGIRRFCLQELSSQWERHADQ